MQLTPHFSRSELERSSLATRNNISNVTPAELMPNLQRIAELLESARAHTGDVIRVSSGYRSPAINAMAGGAKNSAHMEARAADINADGFTPMQLAQSIAFSSIRFDKLIMEFGAWVHIQVSKDGELPRQQVLTAKHTDKGTVYVNGLEDV